MAYDAGGLEGGRMDIFIGGGCAGRAQVEGRYWRREGWDCLRALGDDAGAPSGDGMGVSVGRLRRWSKGVVLVFCEHYPRISSAHHVGYIILEINFNF